MGEQSLTAAPWPPESIPGQQPQPRHEPSLSNPLTPERVTALQQKAFLSLLYYFLHPSFTGASLVVQSVKNLPSVGEICVRSLGWEDPLEEGMATHSSTLAWRIPWREEPGGLQSMGSQRVRQD